jgi:hypothetical protein
MSDLPRPTEVDHTIALDWLRYSLRQGEIVSPAALKFIEEREGYSYVLVPETIDPVQLSDLRHGMSGTGPTAAQQALVPVLKTLAERGATCVVVEDELSRKNDPKPSLDGLLLTMFVGDKVIHWADLSGGTDAAILTLHRGSGGYPLNAFVTSASAEELGLVDGADLDSDIAGAAVGSLMAVIVAAYDAETFLIWEPSS